MRRKQTSSASLYILQSAGEISHSYSFYANDPHYDHRSIATFSPFVVISALWREACSPRGLLLTADQQALAADFSKYGSTLIKPGDIFVCISRIFNTVSLIPAFTFLMLQLPCERVTILTFQLRNLSQKIDIFFYF